jgi:diacylglycerol kinase
MQDSQTPRPERSWVEKFRDAFRGTKHGVRGQGSFFVHFFFAAAVIVTAMVLKVGLVEWCILLICITTVLTAEMFNSALESMARAITDQPNPHVGGALDIGSAAVLIAAAGAVVVGTLVFINRLGPLAGWW